MLDLFVAAASTPPPMPKGVDEIKLLIETWTRIGQALVASVGSLALANVKLVCITLIGRCRHRSVRNPSLSWRGVFARGPRATISKSLVAAAAAADKASQDKPARQVQEVPGQSTPVSSIAGQLCQRGDHGVVEGVLHLHNNYFKLVC